MKGGGVQRGGIAGTLMAALADLAAQSTQKVSALPMRGMFVGRPGGRAGPGPRNPAGSKLLRRIAKHKTGRRRDYYEARRLYAQLEGQTVRQLPYGRKKDHMAARAQA